MRIYCWDYPSWDAVPPQYKHNSLTFDHDIKNGMVVLCGYCGEEFELLKDTETCPHCNKDLVFPRADW